MAKLNQSEVNVNWILVLLIGLFGPIGMFVASNLLMKMPNAWLGRTIFMFIPILNLCVWIDTFLLAKKLQEEGSVDEYDHPLSFLAGLPLMHE
jgi:uncharacterized membrane protein YfcA